MRKSLTARDAGLRTASAATKWIAGAAAVLTGLLTVWEVHSSHDANATPAVVQQPSTPSTTNPTVPDSGSSELQPPDVAPAPTEQPPAANSGAS
jgi:hypothetical protein